MTVPTEKWHQVPVSDAADYLDRPAPKYLEGDEPPEGGRVATELIELRSVEERNRRRREFFETHGYVHQDGTVYEPRHVPAVDPHDDDDLPAGQR